jgi:hypothetical protein
MAYREMYNSSKAVFNSHSCNDFYLIASSMSHLTWYDFLIIQVFSFAGRSVYGKMPFNITVKGEYQFIS